MIIEAGRDAGELRGRQIVTDFIRSHGYSGWQDLTDRGAADAPELIRELQKQNERTWKSA